MIQFQQTILTAALHYAAMGWAVFPVHAVFNGVCTCGKPDCIRQGKHPATAKGLKDATTDAEQIKQWFSVPRNIGIATGAASGFWVLDIDGQPGEDSLNRLIANHGQLPVTLTHYTGRGKHYLFSMPEGKIPNRVSKLGQGIDCRGDGGYIVAAPSIHKNGNYYRFADPAPAIAPAPQWLVDAITAKPEPVTAPVAAIAVPQQTEADLLRDQLNYLHPDCDYQTWIEIGMALHHEGDGNFSLWDEWSSKGSKYKGQKDLLIHWKSFRENGGITPGSIWHMATAAGWRPPEQENQPLPPGEMERMNKLVAALLNRTNDDAPALAPTEADDPGDFDPFSLPGIIGQTVSWIDRTAIKPQPELALMATLAVLGAIFGRKYASPIDTRTNLYIVGVSDTGSGKEHPRSSIKRIMKAAGLEHFLAGDEIISASGLLRTLEVKPASIVLLDEFGMFMKAITDEKAQKHHRDISKVFTQLYSSSGSVYTGGEYATSGVKQIQLTNPNLCIYGTTTQSSYSDSLTRSAIASGELNRFIVYPSGNPFPEPRRSFPDRSIPNDLIHAWQRLKHAGGVEDSPLNNIPQMEPPPPIVVKWDSVLTRIQDLGDFEYSQNLQDPETGPLWNRYRENVIKIAMIFAICRDDLFPEITAQDLDIAERICKGAVIYMASLFHSHVYENQFEKLLKKTMEALRKRGGYNVPRRDLIRAVRVSAKELDTLISALVERGDVQVNQNLGGGHRFTYTLLEVEK